MAADSSAEHPKDAFLREQFARVLEHLGQDLVPEDSITAELFLSTDEHLTASDMVARLKPEHPHIDESFVRRTMRLLCDLGIAQQTQLGNRTVFEHLHLQTHHDHLVCLRCGRIEEFESHELETEQFQACTKAGFQPLMHRLEIRGLCAHCAGALPVTRALTSCLPGEAVVVHEVVGGKSVRRRLTELGLTRGTPLRILSADGPVALEVRGSRIALGRGQAAKVMVKRPAAAGEAP